ncbi:MAG: TetR/AcrR family transcriptional regulator [Nitrososphaerota archaeon]|nr:TetR/AcrR family transcriptional regulator [Nitrososphaerota archaeon]
MQASETHETAERILQVASKMFAEKGFANVSVREICRETGTTAPVIYYYFGSKKGLFDAVAREKITMADFIQRLSSVSKAKDPKKGLENFIASYLTSFPEHTFDIGLYMRDSATLDKRSAQMVFDDLEKIKGIATELVEEAITKGVFRKSDPSMASDCLLGMLNRDIFERIHFARGSNKEAYRRFVTDFFFRAMA